MKAVWWAGNMDSHLWCSCHLMWAMWSAMWVATRGDILSRPCDGPIFISTFGMWAWVGSCCFQHGCPFGLSSWVKACGEQCALPVVTTSQFSQICFTQTGCASLHIPRESRKISLPGIYNVSSEFAFAIRLLTRRIQCHRIALPRCFCAISSWTSNSTKCLFRVFLDVLVCFDGH